VFRCKRLGVVALLAVVVLACGSVENAASLGAGFVRGDAQVSRDGDQVDVKPDSGTTVSTAACLPALTDCDAPRAACCPGTLCVERAGSKKCVATCTSRFDCGSLCCLTDTATGESLCADTALCAPIACSAVAGVCDGPGRSCCDGLTCISSPDPDYSGCRKPCLHAPDCDTGCCVPYSNGATGFCAKCSP
jgi:hypothetical protein